MFHRAHILRFCLILLILIGGKLPLPSQTNVIEDTNGIRSFEFHANGLYYWENRGTCEITRNDVIRRTTFLDTESPLFTYLMNECSGLSDNTNVARSSNYYYFFDDGSLNRKASYAGSTSPSLVTPVLYSGTEIPGPVAWGDDGRLYWGLQLAIGTSQIWSSDAAGSDRQLEYSASHGIGSNAFGQLMVRHYTTGGVTRTFMIFTIGDSFNKSLYTREVGSTADPVVVSNWITEFTYYRDVPGVGDRIFAARNETLLKQFGGSILRVVPSTGGSSTIYADAGATIRSLTVDDNNYYWIEPGPFRIKRRAHGSSATPDTILTVETTSLDNIRSNGTDLFFIRDENRIQRLSTGAPPVVLDLAANGVEPIQTTQILEPTPERPRMYLVAGRDTLVRGYGTIVDNNTGQPEWNTAASLRLFNDGEPVEGIMGMAYARIGPDTTPQNLRGDDGGGRFNNSFLFHIPGRFIQPGLMEFRMNVNEFNNAPETDTARANNTSSFTVTVIDTGRPTISFKAINHQDQPTVTFRNVRRLPQIVERAKSFLPYADVRVREASGLLEKLVITPNPLEFFHRWDPFDMPGDQDNALVHLSIDQLFNNWIGGTLPVGMVHWDVPSFNGLGFPLTGCLVRMAWNEGDNFGWNLAGGTLAHEWGHVNFHYHVLNHASCGTIPEGPYAQYPYDPCNLGPDEVMAYYGLDPLTRRIIAPTDAGDFMSYRLGRWTSPWTWENWLSPNIIPQLKTVEPDQDAAEPKTTVDGPALIIGGLYNPESTEVTLRNLYVIDGELFPDPTFTQDWASVQKQEPEVVNAVNQLDSGSQLLRSDPILVQPVAEGVDGNFMILGMVPFDTDTALLEIEIQGELRHTVARSPNAPSIILGTPEYDSAEETLSLNWYLFDQDGDRLETLIVFSNDDGASWQPIAAEYPYFGITLDATKLPGGTTCRIMIIVTDGMNSTSAVSESFALPRRPPEPIISGIEDGQHLPYSERIEVYGIILDSDDGSLPAEAMHWQYTGPESGDGTGTFFAMEGLPPGDYTLTLSGENSDAMEGSASRSFTIDPVTVPFRPLPVLDGHIEAAYDNAQLILLPDPQGGFVEARILSAGGSVWISMIGAVHSPAVNSAVGIFIDANNSADATLQTDDFGYLVDEFGELYQYRGTPGSSLELTPTPHPGFDARIIRAGDRFNVEMRLDHALFGGAETPFRFVLFNLYATGSAFQIKWPPSAELDSPATWAEAILSPLGDEPPLLLPIANAGGDMRKIIDGPETIILNGTGSYDPNDKGGLTYEWVQLEGPPVSLAGADTATPSFDVDMDDEPRSYRFQLTVENDLGPATDEVLIGLLPRPTRLSISDHLSGWMLE